MEIISSIISSHLTNKSLSLTNYKSYVITYILCYNGGSNDGGLKINNHPKNETSSQ